MTASVQPNRALVAAAFVAIYLIWGSNFLAIRYAVETIPPFTLMGIRSLLAAAALLGWSWWREGSRPWTESWRGAAVTGSLLFLVGHGALAWGQQSIDSSHTALIMATIPLWVVLLEWRWLDSGCPTPTVWVGLALCLTGIALLVRPGQGGVRGGAPIPVLSALVLLASALGWAAGSVASRLVKLPSSVALSTGMQLAVGGVLLLGVAAVTGELGVRPAVSVRSAYGMAYMVVLASVVGFTAYAWLLRVSTPGRVSSYAFVNPVVAVFVGWGLGGEPLTAGVMTAAGIIVTGVVLIVASRSR